MWKFLPYTSAVVVATIITAGGIFIGLMVAWLWRTRPGKDD